MEKAKGMVRMETQIRKAGCIAIMVTVSMALAFCLFGVPMAYAQPELASGDVQALTTQAEKIELATTSAKKLNKLTVSDAKAIVKAAGASTGTAKEKLSKIYTYVATPKMYKGVFESTGYYDFIIVAMNTASASFYPFSGPSNMKDYYKKYVADSFKSKKVTCYHSAALFAAAAKQALGSGAKVRLAIGGTNITGTWNAHHSWVEVTIKKTTYIYDPMNGHYYSTDIAKAKDKFGPFCGSKKSAAKVKKYYKNGSVSAYKNASYCVVTL